MKFIVQEEVRVELMDKVKSFLGQKPNPQQLLRDWQRRLRQEGRNIERQIRGMFISMT